MSDGHRKVSRYQIPPAWRATVAHSEGCGAFAHLVAADLPYAPGKMTAGHFFGSPVGLSPTPHRSTPARYSRGNEAEAIIGLGRGTLTDGALAGIAVTTVGTIVAGPLGRDAALPSASAEPLTASSMKAAEPTSVRRIRPRPFERAARTGRRVDAGPPRGDPLWPGYGWAPAREEPEPGGRPAAGPGRTASSRRRAGRRGPGGRVLAAPTVPPPRFARGAGRDASGRDGAGPDSSGREPARWARSARPATKPLAIAGILSGAGGGGTGGAARYSRAPRLRRLAVSPLGSDGSASRASRDLINRCSATSAWQAGHRAT